jgi:hypothetical protein
MKGISYRPLSDMESNGVYFDKDELLLLGDDSMCQYSGLPSVESYMVKDDVKVPEEDKIVYTL